MAQNTSGIIVKGTANERLARARGAWRSGSCGAAKLVERKTSIVGPDAYGIRSREHGCVWYIKLATPDGHPVYMVQVNVLSPNRENTGILGERAVIKKGVVVPLDLGVER